MAVVLGSLFLFESFSNFCCVIERIQDVDGRFCYQKPTDGKLRIGFRGSLQRLNYLIHHQDT